MGRAIALLAPFALGAIIFTEDGWMEAVAVAELLALAFVLMLLLRWERMSTEEYQALADMAIVSVEEHRAYGQRITDVNAEAVAALADHDPDEAGRLAGEFLDAYSLYKERMPDSRAYFPPND